MRAKIKEVNFTTQFEWVFKLIDNDGFEYFIMNINFYKANHLNFPIGKNELDSFYKGQWINILVKKINDVNIVLSY